MVKCEAKNLARLGVGVGKQSALLRVRKVVDSHTDRVVIACIETLRICKAENISKLDVGLRRCRGSLSVRSRGIGRDSGCDCLCISSSGAEAPVSVVVAAVTVVKDGSVVEEESLIEEELGRHSPALTPANVTYAKIVAISLEETMLVNGRD